MRIKIVVLIIGLLAAVGLVAAPANAAVTPVTFNAMASNHFHAGQPLRVGLDEVSLYATAWGADGVKVPGTVVVTDAGTTVATLDPGWPIYVDPVTTPGAHTFTFAFTPKDPSKYASATATVTLDAIAAAPQATTTEISIIGGSSTANPQGIVVNKDTARISASVQWMDGADSRMVESGSIKVHVDGVLATPTWQSPGWVEVSVGPYAATGKHTVTAEYVPSTAFTASSSNSSFDVIEANPAGDAIAEFFRNFQSCLVKWLFAIFNPSLIWMAPHCPWF